MNPYSDEELGVLRREVMMRIAPTSDELQRVYEYGAYEAPRLNIPQQTMEQLEKMGILNAIRTMQGSMDKWDTTLGNVSPYSVMNRARLPEPYRSQGLDWDAVQENMPGFGPADIGIGAIFAGAKAKNFPQATGKFSALWDRMPRFEIDDSNARLLHRDFGVEMMELKQKDPKQWAKIERYRNMGWMTKKQLENYDKALADAGLLAPETGAYNTLGAQLYHPELFENYPELRDMPIRWAPDWDSSLMGARASFAPNRGIAVNRDVGGNDLQKVLHEVQHGVQEHEGFAQGGSPASVWAGSLRPKALAEYQALLDVARVQGVDPVPAWLDLELQKSAGEKVYRNLAGEFEARNAAARSDIPGALRQYGRSNEGLAPYTSENIPLEELITISY